MFRGMMLVVVVGMAMLSGSGTAQSAATSQTDGSSVASPSNEKDPHNWIYPMKGFARAAGNVGGWWSFLTEAEKEAFLDGYQEAMFAANMRAKIECRILKEDVDKDPEMPIKATSMAIEVCLSVANTADFEKVAIKDIDEFYSDPINQPVILEWTMPYLRDKVTGRKTKGQLLDALEAEQKDVHDCSKYAYLCKLGVADSAPSK